jgi:hypothetical protein
MTRPDYLRVGDAERDQMIESLHEHFVQGRLNSEELDERLAATMTAKTVGDLSRIGRDLPQPVTAQAPAVAQAHWQGPWGNPAWRGHHHLDGHQRDLPWHQRRHGPRPIRLLLAAAILITVVSATAGAGWAVLAVARILFMIFLIRMVVSAVHERRWHRMHKPPR